MKSRILLLLLLFSTIVSSVGAQEPGTAQPSTTGEPAAAPCVGEFDAAQAQREEGKLLAARESLVACAQASCPDIIEAKCNEWLTELDKEIPSIVVSVEPPPDQIAGIQVAVDGNLVEGGLNGRPVSLDPGPHDVRVTFPDGKVETQKVIVAQGEQNRKVVISLAVPQPDPVPGAVPPGPRPITPEPTGGISPLVWVGFGVAVVGGIVGGITGGVALSKSSDIKDACGGFQCDPSHEDDLDQGEALAHVSTVSFAVAGAGAAVGIIGLVLSDFGGGQEAALVPMIGPGVVGLRGRF